MNTSIQTLPAGGVNTKPLWAAVALLGVAVVALGAGLVYTQTRDTGPAVATMAATQAAAASTAAPAGLPVTAVADDEVLVTATQPAPVTQHKSPAVTAPAPAKVARVAPPAAPKAVRATTPAPAPRVAYRTAEPNYRTPAPQSVRVAAPARVCASCGEVVAVNAVQRPATTQGIGVGAIAGGVAGAVLGNQVGKGNGRKLATVLGAVGGGYAGHEIEKNVRKVTVYQVRVRMDDGSVRNIEHPTMPAIGTPVIVDGNGAMRSANGTPAYTPQPKALPQQAKVYTTDRS